MKSQRILLATHESPDGDGIASMLALFNWLEAVKPETSMLFSKDKIPRYLDFLPERKKFAEKIPEGEYNLLIGLDYGDFGRMGLDSWLKTQPDIRIITFDHHPGGRQFGNINIIDDSYSSTAELLYDFFEANEIKIGKDIAGCLLCGIAVDTGIFKHSNTTPKTLRTVKNLMLKGAVIGEAAKHLESGLRPLSALHFWGEALLRIKIDSKTGLAVSFAVNEDYLKHNASQEHLSEFSSLMSEIPETKFSVFLAQDQKEPQFIKGSLRSENYKGADVSLIAKHFGGGGHKLASGFKIESTMEEVLERLISAAKTV